MVLRVLSFDLDDTLWPVMPTILRAEQVLFQWMQQHVPEITQHYDIDSLREHRLQLRDSTPEISHCMTELRLASFRDLSARHDHHQDWVEDAFEVFYHERQQIKFYEEVADVLDLLSQRYRMVALSNGNADIALTGADRWMEFCMSPAEAGVAKPHPDIFSRLVQRAGIEPGELVHIGDDPLHDIQGAIEAGITSVWVDRNGAGWQHQEFRPDAEITDLSELPSVLAGFEKDR